MSISGTYKVNVLNLVKLSLTGSVSGTVKKNMGQQRPIQDLQKAPLTQRVTIMALSTTTDTILQLSNMMHTTNTLVIYIKAELRRPSTFQ